MHKYTRRARPRNPHQLDLFDDWMREQDFRAAYPVAVQWARRHGVSVYRAALLMHLICIGTR
jgi:hypothetical protein